MTQAQAEALAQVLVQALTGKARKAPARKQARKAQSPKGTDRRLVKAASMAERNPAWLPGSPKTLAWEAAHPDAEKLPALVKPKASSKREPLCPKGCKPFEDIKLAAGDKRSWEAEGLKVKPSQVTHPVGHSGKTGAGLFCRHQLVA